MGVEKIFPGEANSGFSIGSRNTFPGGTKVVKFNFFPSKLSEQPFLVKNVIKNVKFQDPGAKAPHVLLPAPMIT